MNIIRKYHSILYSIYTLYITENLLIFVDDIYSVTFQGPEFLVGHVDNTKLIFVREKNSIRHPIDNQRNEQIIMLDAKNRMIIL